jgi:hypothetical protein
LQGVSGANIGGRAKQRVLDTVANFSGQDQISDHERGVLLHMVIEMNHSGSGISIAEADRFSNRVEAMSQDRENFYKTDLTAAGTLLGGPPAVAKLPLQPLDETADLGGHQPGRRKHRVNLLRR